MLAVIIVNNKSIGPFETDIVKINAENYVFGYDIIG